MGYHSYITRDRDSWNAYVNRALISEAYHTWHYHSLNKEGEAVLFVVNYNGDFIALPLIKRKIKDSSFFDLTSVYGYAGPISNVDLSNIPAQWISYFRTAFVDFMSAEKCICVFSRLHPFINQHLLIQSIGDVRGNGNTIYIDLQQPVEMQRSKYHKRLSRQIRQLYKADYIIREASSSEEIRDFTEIYHENMDRLGASPAYYFDEQYFKDLLKNDQFQCKLILVYEKTQLICGAVIFLSKTIVRNHLSATSATHLNESPSKMLTDYISIIGRDASANVFHLGGGVGGRRDSLFTFKSYFSDQEIEDRIWCYINDKKTYDALVQEYSNNLADSTGYFPAYRQNFSKETVQTAD
ncbi:MAG TPA: GNAT family N-acetyltransferase [Pedobacter sp.]|nr:GNAT family N-acetyltransferase [Pedobacter sp.]